VHTHTTESDGRLTASEATRFYADSGYDFIAITDHMVPFVASEHDDTWPLLVLDGIELHGDDSEGSFYHVVAIGDVAGVTPDMDFTVALEEVRARDCILIWAHPHWSGNTAAEGMRHHFHGIEVYNASSQVAWGKGLGAFHWDATLEHQPNMLGFAADDAHFIEAAPLERGGWIMVNAPELSREALTHSIRRGNFYSSNGPTFKSITIEQGNRVVVETSPVVHARLIGPRDTNKYKGTFHRDPMTETHFRINEDWPFARLEIENVHGKIAWTNPLLVT
jgi:hypothetical protein